MVCLKNYGGSDSSASPEKSSGSQTDFMGMAPSWHHEAKNIPMRKRKRERKRETQSRLILLILGSIQGCKFLGRELEGIDYYVQLRSPFPSAILMKLLETESLNDLYTFLFSLHFREGSSRLRGTCVRESQYIIRCIKISFFDPANYKDS